MIPKQIHYCWFGGNPLPDSAKKCIESWKKFCSDYEIIEWNESNFDVNCCEYVHEAYEAKKWAFVSDVARLYIVAEHGGIYLDTDVELIKPLDSLLKYNGFMGFEEKQYVALGLGFGAIKGNPLVCELAESYRSLSFIREDGSYNLKPIPHYTTEIMEKHGLQTNGKFQMIDGVAVFPKEYFCPFDYNTGKMNITPNTYSIHWYDASWYDESSQYGKLLKWKLSKIMPAPIALKVSRFVAIVKFRRFKEAFSNLLIRLKKKRD
jgi:mannosyltransferase OCH1-like enzyme